MVTHTRNSCSAFNHTHSSEHTHTVNTHPEQWAAIYAAAPGSSWGFGALLKGTSVVVLSVERALYIHSPQLQFLPAQDSNSQPLDYESESLTIRPRLPPYKITPTAGPCRDLWRGRCSKYKRGTWNTAFNRAVLLADMCIEMDASVLIQQQMPWRRFFFFFTS